MRTTHRPRQVCLVQPPDTSIETRQLNRDLQTDYEQRPPSRWEMRAAVYLSKHPDTQRQCYHTDWRDGLDRRREVRHNVSSEEAQHAGGEETGDVADRVEAPSACHDCFDS